MLAPSVANSRNLSLIFDQVNNLRDDITKEKKATERERVEAKKKEAAILGVKKNSPY